MSSKAKSRRNPGGLQGFLTKSGRKIRRQDVRGEILNRLLGKPDGENYDGVLKMLGALFSGENIITEKKRILEQDFDIPMTETLERRLSEMCNLSQGFEERGMKRGFEKGRVESLTEGRIESTISTIRNLMGSMGWTMEQAMDAMQLPATDRPKYAEMLKPQ